MRKIIIQIHPFLFFLRKKFYGIILISVEDYPNDLIQIVVIVNIIEDIHDIEDISSTLFRKLEENQNS